MSRQETNKLNKLISTFSVMLNRNEDPRQAPQWKTLSKEDKQKILECLRNQQAHSADSAPPVTHTYANKSKADAAGAHSTAGVSSVTTQHTVPSSPASARAEDPLLYVDRKSALRMLARGDKARLRHLKRLEKEVTREAGLVYQRIARAQGFSEAIPDVFTQASTEEGGVGGEGVSGEAEELMQGLKHSLSALLDEPPQGTHFYNTVKMIMHGAGDGIRPSSAAAAMLDAEVVTFVPRLVAALRTCLKKEALKVADVANTLPASTAAYFRWKAMKNMAKESKEETAAGEEGFEDSEASSDGEATSAGMRGADAIGEEDSSRNDSVEALQHIAHDALPTSADVVDEDEAEQLQVASLAAQAEERLLGGTDSADREEAEALMRFHARLSFANSRSKLMSAKQYALYARARERGFTSTKTSSQRFASLIPRPALSPAVLEVISYLAYDRVCSIVEAANRIENGGILRHMYDADISQASYAGALAAAKVLPDNLDDLLEAEKIQEQQREELERLAAARVAMKHEVEKVSQTSHTSKTDDAAFAELLKTSAPAQSDTHTSGSKRKLHDISS